MAFVPQDQAARTSAINPAQSFAVSAPAGSGKTGLLTQRVLTLLATVDHPEEVLAITFTRKAAGEMQDRILHALEQARTQAAPTDPHALTTWSLARDVLLRDTELNWGLMQNPQRLRVTTIDSLCRNLTQQMPLASAMGAQPQLLDNPEAAYLLAVRELFIQAERDTPLYTHLAHLLSHLDNDLQKIETLLATLLAQRDQWLGAILAIQHHDNAKQYFERVIGDTVAEHLSLTRQSFAPLASEFCRLADAAGSQLKNDGVFTNAFVQFSGMLELPPAEASALDTWQLISQFLLTADNTYRKTLNKNQGFVAGKEGKALKESMLELLGLLPEVAPALADQLAWIKHLPSAQFSDGQWQMLESLSQILPHLSAQLLLVFKQLGATDFIQISQAALTALGDADTPSDLALQLDYKIKHILIDEFQDTSSTQLELIEKLTAGWQPGDGRSLFIVGDGMQSCYGFRNARVGIFLNARARGIGSTPLTPADLQVNFRSQAGVVEWVNRVFKDAFPPQDEIARGAVKYAPSLAFKAAQSTPAVHTHIHTFTRSDDDAANPAGDAERAEAARIATIISDALRERPEQSIAILVKSRGHLKYVVPALNARGIQYQANNIDSLSSRLSISDLRSLTRALLDTSDRIAWLALLRSPLIGLTLADLHALATAKIDINPALGEAFAPLLGQLLAAQSLSTLSDDAQLRIARCLLPLTAALENRQRYRLEAWIEGVWLTLGGPASLGGASELEDCRQFFNLLARFTDAGTISDWQGFDAALAQLYAAPDVGGDVRVQIMTIHKSKGLEFDTVIIPQLHKAGKSDGNELLLLHERLAPNGASELLLSALGAVGDDPDPIYRFIKEEDKKQKDYEATRLLYVGCTRAIDTLILTGCLEATEDGVKAPPKPSLLAKIWPQIEPEVKCFSDSVSSRDTPAEHLAFGGDALVRLPLGVELPRFPEAQLLSQPVAVPTESSGALLNRPSVDMAHNRLARHLGTLIHELLEDLTLTPALSTLTPAQLIHERQSQWHSRLADWGWSETAQAQTIAKISIAVGHVLQTPLGQWVVNSAHPHTAAELNFARHDRQGIREFIVDRTFVSEGVRWVIDYKTAEPLAEEALEGFFAREMALYRPQLQNYARLIKASRSNEEYPIKTAVYFVLLNRLVETHEYPALAPA